MSSSAITAILAGAATALLGGGGVASFKWLGKWVRRMIKIALDEAVTEIVHPHLDRLTTSVQTGRDDNSRDHAEVTARLNILETRVGRIEAHLTIDPEPSTTDVPT